MFDSHAHRPIPVKFPASGIFVLESHHARGFRMEPTRHDFLKIIQPFAGTGWMVRHGARVPLRSGDVVLVPAGDRHHIEDDGARPLSLYALCVAPRALPSGTRAELRYRHFAAPQWGSELRAVFRHLLHEQTLRRPGSEFMLAGFAWQALGHVARAASASKSSGAASTDDQPARARVAAYAEQLSRTFYSRQSVDAAAAALGLSRRHFTHLFRAVTGDSWLSVIQQHRLAHARHLLRDTRRSVTSIAFESGFGDVSSFYRMFLRAEHVSPLTWRKDARTRKE